MLKRLSLFCICVIMFSAIVVAFHHHDDGDDHEDCPVCSASLHHSPAVFVQPVQDIHQDFTKTEFFTPAIQKFVKTFSATVNCRAPPA